MQVSRIVALASSPSLAAPGEIGVRIVAGAAYSFLRGMRHSSSAAAAVRGGVAAAAAAVAAEGSEKMWIAR